ncbi:glycosyltransferase family 39 protein [Dyadobacter sp. CY323]|uniref:ArnT family glycosyltransferase n=1 Tax=Dyadobacter sp. CY323 TaxID=2907302 RepID=UPI001F3DDD43|nr:glycosyltransferase family 39 protein [Dyadobacter sp. CY323]MCE6990750.1 glycosyltransferase family 39 protein [Dyadobacter sp. CY323]
MPLQENSSDRLIRLLSWTFTLSFVLITFLPRSLDDTMFMDGVTYASISRNMSLGIGSFWRPYFAESFWLPYDNASYFSGHPPLMFGLQSLLFRMMGDTTAVENVYDLLILICSILLIVKIWNKLFAENPAFKSFSWLAILCWYGMTIVYYSMPNNFLDSTMGVFCLLSCYFQLIFLEETDPGFKKYIWAVAAGLFVLCAFLTKGPVGLFPLAFSVLYAFTFLSGASFFSAIKAAAVVTGTFLVCLAAVLTFKPAYEFMSTYFQGQVIQAVFQKREQTGVGLAGHFQLMKDLFRNVYPHLFALIGLNLIALLYRLKLAMSSEVLRITLFSGIVGLSGILPMLVSIKQYPHYLLPALPFIAFFAAGLLVEKVRALMSLKPTYATIALVIATLVSWGVTVKKMNSPEKNVFASNAREMRHYVAKSSTIGVCHDLYHNADIHSNFQRYHFLSLTTNIDSVKYILANTDCLPQFDPKKCAFVDLDGGFALVIRNTSSVRNVTRKR